MATVTVVATAFVTDHARMDMSSGSRAVAAKGLPLGAVLGILVGCTSWVFGLLLLCIAEGRADMIWPVVVPVLCGSFGVATSVLLVLTLVHRLTPARRDAVRGPVMFGSMFVAMGSLLLLADGFVTPLLASEPKLGDVVRASGGVLGMPTEFACALLVAGCALLFGVMRKLTKLVAA